MSTKTQVEYNQEWRKKNPEKVKKQNSASYLNIRASPQRYLCRKYSCMKTRVDTQRTYMGLPIMSRQDFYKWSNKDSTYLDLHKRWKDAGFPRRLSPSVDRIDLTRGYVLGNVRWMTQAENCGKAFVEVDGINRKSPGASFFRGLSLVGNKYQAAIFNKDKKVHIGQFATEEEAAEAYDQMAFVIYGKRINFPEKEPPSPPPAHLIRVMNTPRVPRAFFKSGSKDVSMFKPSANVEPLEDWSEDTAFSQDKGYDPF